LVLFATWPRLPRPRTVGTLALILLLGTVVEVGAAHPYFISYGNILTGGSARVPDYLSDSNVDWGQGLIALSDWQRTADAGTLYLSYFGNALPSAYGVPFEPLPAFGPLDGAESSRPPVPREPIVVGISVLNLQGVYLDDTELYAPFRAVEPDAFLAGSIALFRLDRSPQLRPALIALLKESGWRRTAARLRIDARPKVPSNRRSGGGCVFADENGWSVWTTTAQRSPKRSLFRRNLLGHGRPGRHRRYRAGAGVMPRSAAALVKKTCRSSLSVRPKDCTARIDSAGVKAG
jgi:hypothetical protein